jgi:hypothetical protein
VFLYDLFTVVCTDRGYWIQIGRLYSEVWCALTGGTGNRSVGCRVRCGVH